MKSQGASIKSTVRTPYMKSVIAKTGWSEQEAANKVVDYLSCGQKLSLYDFMEAAAAVSV